MKLSLALAVLCLFHVKQQVKLMEKMLKSSHFKVNLFFSKVSGEISDLEVREVAKLDDQNHYQNALRNILVPRVVGTPGWRNVQNFIINELKAMDVTVELDSFEDTAPIFGKLNFVNIIGKINPKADRFLMLSAHYDSKYFANGNFVGATGERV